MGIKFILISNFTHRRAARRLSKIWPICKAPRTQQDLDGLRAKYGDLPLPPLKAIRSKNGAAGSRQFVVLFESLHRELPIRRVIVGPSRNQDKNFTKALELLGSGLKIERSETPFIERATVSCLSSVMQFVRAAKSNRNIRFGL